LWKLKYDKPLTHKDRGALNGLEALGLVTNGRLTRWGVFFIKDEGVLPTPKPAKPCQIHNHRFVVSLPQHADLLWKLEKYLRPVSPGCYPLTRRALQLLEDNPYDLILLLERGLQTEIPKGLKAAILKQPSIRVAEGIVLEFSSPAELKQLRRQPLFRKYIDEFLSPQRVLVSNDKADSFFKMLKRRGVCLDRNAGQVERRRKRTYFQQVKQKTMLEPVGRHVPIITILEKYRDLQQALDILYRAPGYPPEHRRITPLDIEERGGHTYVIAYCQTRRAQRTFRLDRIKVPGTW
jgi:hypothetical protein